MKKIVVFTGAGISAESGLSTFRDQGGLWDKYPIDEVATPEAFVRNPKKVLDFYNLRRKMVAKALPNEAHKALVKLESYYDVCIVTQNIDDLHERAGSKNVLHLHGEITKARSSATEAILYEVGDKPIAVGDCCEIGSQLRPHVVWFGEAVPMMDKAFDIVAQADVFIVVGSSLNVYPAAHLTEQLPLNCKCYLIDPNALEFEKANFEKIPAKANLALPQLVEQLLKGLT